MVCTFINPLSTQSSSSQSLKSYKELEIWKNAEIEYKRIIEENLERQYLALSLLERERFVATVRQSKPNLRNDKESILNEMRSRSNLRNYLHHHKSPLFKRLLEGKKGLAFPPPRSNSYPWYEVIECEGPFPVSVSNTFDLNNSGIISNTNYSILINQCQWEILSMNDGAQELLELDFLLRKNMKQHEIKSPHRAAQFTYIWSDDLYKKVILAYTKKPRFVVQFPNWPTYTLSLEMTKSNSRRDVIEDIIHGENRENYLMSTSTVFDASSLYINCKFGEITYHALHPQQILEESQRKFNNMEHKGNFERLWLDDLKKNLQRDIDTYNSRPNGFDRINFISDHWFLHKEK